MRTDCAYVVTFVGGIGFVIPFSIALAKLDASPYLLFFGAMIFVIILSALTMSDRNNAQETQDGI